MSDDKIRDSYAAVLDAPPDRIAEFVSGNLYLSPRPAPKHAAAATALAGALHDPWHKGRGGPGGWWILLEPEVHLEDEIVVPDVAGWRRERMDSLPATAFFETVPDWVCEIVSPATGRLDRVLKAEVYAASGVDFLWFVDPATRTLDVLRRKGREWVPILRTGGAELASAAPFETVPMELQWLWS